MQTRLQWGCPAIPGTARQGHLLQQLLHQILAARGTMCLCWLLWVREGKSDSNSPGCPLGHSCRANIGSSRGLWLHLCPEPLPRVSCKHEAATSTGGQALAPHHTWSPGSPAQAAGPTPPPGWHEGQWGEVAQGAAGQCSSPDIVPPVKLCHPQAPLPAPGLLRSTGCHAGGGSREQLIFPASFVVKPSLSSSTALLRMPVGCGIAQLHQQGFRVPGEPHCQPEAPGAAGGAAHSTLQEWRQLPFCSFYGLIGDVGKGAWR